MDDDMWTKGYDDAWSGFEAEHTNNEAYMLGYKDAESDMEDELHDSEWYDSDEPEEI